MKAIKVLLDFVRFAVPTLIEFARNITLKMTANAAFATPFVPLAQLISSVNDVEAKYNASQNGGKQQKAELRAAVKALLILLRKQALYIDNVANGNETLILSTGFHISHQPSSSRHSDFTVENGKNEGELIVRHKAVKGARVYILEHCDDPLSADGLGWKLVAYSTKATQLISNLVPATKHWYRISWVTKNGQSSWSAPLMKIVV